LRTESTFQRSIDCKPVRWYCWAIRSWDRFSELRPTYHGCRTLTFALARLSCKLPCKPVMLCDKPLSFVNEAKYLGVCLLSGLKFKASLHYMKCNFFRSFNSVYQKCCRANRETVVLQLVQFFRKPHLLYATECLQLSHTAIIKLTSAWFCALSEIFHVKGSDDFISEMCERNNCFETEVANRRARFCRKLVVINSPLFIPFIKSND